MKLKSFKEKNKKKIGIIIFTITCILLISGVVLYRTFAIFNVSDNFNVINGRTEDVEDIYFAFYIDGVASKTMPDKNGNYVVDYENSSCGVLGQEDKSISFEYKKEENTILVNGVKQARTKCTIYFKKGETLIEKLKNLSIKEETSLESGIYAVHHEDATITSTQNETEIANLKETEYRYAGSNPNNYVKLGNDLWRILGIVNTINGQRVKLVRNDSIGKYSWDSSDKNVNGGAGVNEWSEADLMFELNYMYLNNGSGYCKNSANNSKILCDFSTTGLKNAKKLIDQVTWNIGITDKNNYYSGVASVNTKDMYDFERSNISGKNCTSGDYCNDNLQHTFIWNGMIGLLSPTDIVYASSGNSNQSRENCISFAALKSNSDCVSTNYLIPNSSFIASEWLLNPYNFGSAQSINAMAMYYQIDNDLVRLSSGGIYASLSVRPSFYLKTNVLILSGDGSINHPYVLTL